MNKKDAIYLINSKKGIQKLNSRNTHWSDIIKYGKDFGWWLNIPFHKFKDELFIILNDLTNEKLIFIKISGGIIQNPEIKFRNKENTADIFISYNDKRTLTDTQSNSSNFQFANYIVSEFSWKSQT